MACWGLLQTSSPCSLVDQKDFCKNQGKLRFVCNWQVRRKERIDLWGWAGLSWGVLWGWGCLGVEVCGGWGYLELRCTWEVEGVSGGQWRREGAESPRPSCPSFIPASRLTSELAWAAGETGFHESVKVCRPIDTTLSIWRWANDLLGLQSQLTAGPDRVLIHPEMVLTLRPRVCSLLSDSSMWSDGWRSWMRRTPATRRSCCRSSLSGSTARDLPGSYRYVPRQVTAARWIHRRESFS